MDIGSDPENQAPSLSEMDDIFQINDLSSIGYNNSVEDNYTTSEKSATVASLDEKTVQESVPDNTQMSNLLNNLSFEDQPLSDDEIGILAKTTKPSSKANLHYDESNSEITTSVINDINAENKALPRHSQSDVVCKIWVKDPQKFEYLNKLGIKASYMTYLVQTEGLAATGGTVESRRRFSEFEALHKLLKSNYRGYFIPPLPEKSFFENKFAGDDFFRLRRADLQAFMRGIASHPLLRGSEIVNIFLAAPGDLTSNLDWQRFLQATQPPPVLKNLFAAPAPREDSASDSGSASTTPHAVATPLAAGWMSWVKQSVGLVNVPRELPEDEMHLRKSKELLQELERLLGLSCESARVLCSHLEAVCEDMRQMGRTLGLLSRFEEHVGATSGQYTEVGRASERRATTLTYASLAGAKQHTLWRSISTKAAASLVMLHDYFILLPEAIAALEERESALSTVQTLEAELGTKQAALASVQSTAFKNVSAFTSREKRVSTLAQAVTSLEEQLRAAKEIYALLKTRNQEELARLNLEREADFRATFNQFAATQAQLMRASADIWASTAEDISSME